MSYCDCCEYANECELADRINFCNDCKDCDECTIKYVTCEAGFYIECNNGFEDKNDYCSEDVEELNFDSCNAPVWQLPVSGSEKTANGYISQKAKHHCFVDNVSLCGKYYQNTKDYDGGITTTSACMLELPQFACKKCLNLWKKQYRVEE